MTSLASQDSDTIYLVRSANDSVDQYFQLTLFCTSEIVGGPLIDIRGVRPACGIPIGAAADKFAQDERIIFNELWCRNMYGFGSALFTPEVIPNYAGTLCGVVETVYDSAVEVDNGCLDIEVTADTGDSCIINNTVFFEGIPTLSQDGMAILALLMMGGGFVGFRRFS